MTVTRALPLAPETTPEPEPEGVWCFSTSNFTNEIELVFRDEISALRYVNDCGYGKAVFVKFTEVGVPNKEGT